MFYSGIDQHKRDSFITTYDDGGAIVNQERVPNTPLRIQRYFAQFPGPHKAVVESTGSWYWLADLLQHLNVDSPSRTPLDSKSSRPPKAKNRSHRLSDSQNWQQLQRTYR